jgi:hypothetical protein
MRILHDLAGEGNGAQLKSSAQILGLLDDHLGGWFTAQTPKEDADARIDALLALRSKVRAEKDFARSDRIRDGLNEVGVAVQDGKDRTIYYIQDRFAQMTILNKKSKLERDGDQQGYQRLSIVAEQFGIHFSGDDISAPAAARVDRDIDLSNIRSERLDSLCEKFGVTP